MSRAGRVALVALALLAVSGCGGNGSGTGPSGAGGGASRGTPAPSTAGTPASSLPASSGAASPPPATEFNPPGDIPDNQVFVDYRVPGSRVHISVPEGWPRTSHAGVTTFSDHYNSVAIQVVPMAAAPTPASARRDEVPALQASVSRFALQQVATIHRSHGTAVLMTYLLDSAPNPVTGKVVRDAAERYEFWKGGQEAVLTLTGPRGADNVDPWRTVSDSLHWQ